MRIGKYFEVEYLRKTSTLLTIMAVVQGSGQWNPNETGRTISSERYNQVLASDAAYSMYSRAKAVTALESSELISPLYLRQFQ